MAVTPASFFHSLRRFRSIRLNLFKIVGRWQDRILPSPDSFGSLPIEAEIDAGLAARRAR
jgi:hypothetical protein